MVTLVVAGTHSGVGKTTVACGLMAACARRGLIVQPFKVGPDFLDGMQHRAALEAISAGDGVNHSHRVRESINLDGWMMKNITDFNKDTAARNVRATFRRHAQGSDVCIVEGVMGLYDGKDGTSEDGSTAQISKYLDDATVVLVIDASKMARSVAAMALGYQNFDPGVPVRAVVANQVGGAIHAQWIRDAVEQQNSKNSARPLFFAGGITKDASAAVQERHLGLKIPTENSEETNRDRFRRLAILMENCLDLDGILQLASNDKSFCSRPRTTLLSSHQHVRAEVQLRESSRGRSICRIAVAFDDAFCFYYHENLHLLRQAGAEIVFFSPISDQQLPYAIDAIYFGGGYPELHAAALEQNEYMRKDVLSFVRAGGVVYAECGGYMYLTQGLYVGQNRPVLYGMCNVFNKLHARITPHMKMHYATVGFNENNKVFPPETKCRGQKFHFGEVIPREEEEYDASEAKKEATSTHNVDSHPAPLTAQPETIRSVPSTQAGSIRQHCIGSFYHLHFASNPYFAKHLVDSALRFSPHRNLHCAVSFVSTATEMIFALGLEEKLAGVTSVCDYPDEARTAPRRIVCRSFIDAETMTSEEVEQAMNRVKRRDQENNEGPGVWFVDVKALSKISPRVVFVQNTCEVCDANQDDVLLALQKTGHLDNIQLVSVAPTTLEGMLESIVDVADALSESSRAINLVKSLRDRLERIKRLLEEQDSFSRPPRVLSLEGLAPPCVGGGWLPDMKAAAGCVDALGDNSGDPPRRLTWQDISDCDPDVLILSPCSGSVERTLKELHLLTSESLFQSLRCVQSGNLYIVDHACFSRPGPRLLDGIELLANLIRGVEIADSDSFKAKWTGKVMKYESCNGDSFEAELNTTELAARFKNVFASPPLSNELNSNVISTSIIEKQDFKRSVISRSTISGQSAPTPRSAHCMVSVIDYDGMASFLVISGEDSFGKRQNDVWKLHLPFSARNYERPLKKQSYMWERLRCDKIADENVPTRRSNYAATVCGRHLLVFGGRGDDNVALLSNCELLHLDTLCWTHCSTRGSVEPSPRGNCTLVYHPRHHFVILYGGSTQKKRMSDLWVLNLSTWTWQQVIPRNEEGVSSWPANRADHSAVLWEDGKGNEFMIVYGGSVDGFGSSSELWVLDCGSASTEEWSWREILIKGTSKKPLGRTAHAAVMVNKGADAGMVVLGGSNAVDCCGKSCIIGDSWMLQDLNGLKSSSCQWKRLEFSGPAVQRCRHTMNCIGTNLVVFGGFDGEKVIEEERICWSASIAEEMSTTRMVSTTIHRSNRVQCVTSEVSRSEHRISRRLQERWAAEIPVRESDVPKQIIDKANRSLLPGAVYKAIHRYAVSIGRDTYIDPGSGYSVFTMKYLKGRPCCGNGCRHCPYGYVNVPVPSSKRQQEKTSGIEGVITSLDDLQW